MLCPLLGMLTSIVHRHFTQLRCLTASTTDRKGTLCTRDDSSNSRRLWEVYQACQMAKLYTLLEQTGHRSANIVSITAVGYSNTL